MTTLIERALSAEERMTEDAKKQFIRDVRRDIETIIGQTNYDLFETPPNILIITEGMALNAYPDDEGEPAFSLIKKCQKCCDLFGFKLRANQISALGTALKDIGVCDCGSEEPLILLGAENAREEVENWNKRQLTTSMAAVIQKNNSRLFKDNSTGNEVEN